jgi:predicted permease
MSDRPPSSSPGWISVLASLLPSRYRAEIMADLLEERESMIASGRSSIAGSIWLFAHVIRSAVASRRHGWTSGARQEVVAMLTRRGRSPLGECRYAMRSLGRAPWYAFTVITVTALGMALATTVFAIVDGVLFKPLPYPEPDELYAVSGRFDGDLAAPDRIAEMVSPNEVSAWAAAAGDILVTGIGYSSLSLPDGSFAFAAAVDPRFFDVFGVRLFAGGFEDDDYVRERPLMPVIISHRLWQSHFGADPNAIGRTVESRSAFGQSYQIVGIMVADSFIPPVPTDAAAARRLNRVDFLRPPFTEALNERSNVAFARIPRNRRAEMVAALDRALATARAAAPAPPPGLTTVQRRIRGPFDRVDLVPLRDYISSRERPVFTMAFGTVMCLVCLVLLNAGALAAARAQQRIRELSLRRALGARTRDLLRHALAEQAILSTIGTLAGLVAAPLLLTLVLDRLPEGTNLVKEARLDWRVLAFAAVLSAAAAFAIALLSVRVAVRQTSTAPVLAEVHGATPTRAGLARLLVATQTAIAFALVLGGVLFAASIARLWNEDPGFQPTNAATMEVTFPVREIRQYRARVARERALELARQLRSMPGVRQAGLYDGLVMRNIEQSSSTFREPVGATGHTVTPAAVSVSGGFFDAAGIELVAGRLPSDAELDTGAPVVVVSESVARAYWPGAEAVGQTLTARNRVNFTVVGVVRDVRLVALDVPPSGVIFWPWAHHALSTRGPKIFVSLQGDAARTLASVRAAAERAAPGATFRNVELLDDAIADTIRSRRLGALAAQAFGVAALVFVAVGLVGLVAMTSSRRTREVGIRLALGAVPTGIVRLLVREQLVAVLAGLSIGGVLAAWLVPIASAHVYAIGVYDLRVWLVATLVIIGTTIISAWLPAHRASRIDPLAALREC